MESQEAAAATTTTTTTAMAMSSNPFTEAQQAQLRAQIIVFGSIRRQGAPFKGLMRLSFADISGRTTDDFEEGANMRMSSWNDIWQAAVKRCESKQTEPDEVPSPPAAKSTARKTIVSKESIKKPAAKTKRRNTTTQKRNTTQQKKEVLEDPELETMAASVLANDFVEDKTTPSVSEEPVEENDNSESNAEGRPVLQIDESEFPTGTEVEVLAVEDGLQGVWFAAEVLSVKDNRVHVRYYDLLVDHGEESLEEWVPYHSGQDRPRVRLAHPVTSADVPIKQKPFPVGEHVDVWLNDGWWEAIVVGVDSEKDSVSLYYPGGGDTNSGKLCNLRRSLVWRDGEWVPWTPQARKSAPRTPPPVRKSPKVEVRKKKVEAPPVILHGKRKRAKPKRLAEALDDDEENEEEASPAKNRRTPRTTARKSRRRS